MCGIAGQARADGAPPAQELLERMCGAIEHRGPDSRGIHRDDGIGLGIQRLRVIDLVTGDQPIFNEDRTVAVVLNGEIYNHERAARAAARERPSLRHAGRHGGDRAPLRGARARLRARADRHVRRRGLGRARAPAGARARPARQEAAVLRRARRAAVVRLGAAGPAAGPLDPAHAGPARARPVPRPALRALAALRLRGGAQAAARQPARVAGGPRPRRDVLAARLRP